MQLMEKIKDDYTINNYLWTGNIYTPAFERGCRFTDPTLTFVGVEKFVTNVKNLRPLIDFCLGKEAYCESKLLEMFINEDEGYIQSRWRMLGELNALPWRPKIDVIGRTKFWYRSTTNDKIVDSVQVEKSEDVNMRPPPKLPSMKKEVIRVYFYDEEWEITPGRALLQLVTPQTLEPNHSNGNV